MHRITYKLNIVTLVFLVFLSVFPDNLKAQGAIPIYTIRHNVERSVCSELAGHAEWGISRLRSNVHATMPKAQAFKLPQASNVQLTPQDIYKQRHESALIFGKAGMCGECPDLHVVFVATATPITADGVCFVNYHMVSPIVSRDAGKTKNDSIFFVADRDGQAYAVTEVLAYSVDDDAAVIKVDTRGNSLSVIPLGAPAEVGQHINIISHPKQMFYTYSQGYVTRNAVYNFPDNPIIDMMEISADFAEGSSGGPVLDDCGNLVGMVRATTTLYHDEQNRTPQMVRKTTVPVKVLKRMLGK